MSADTATLAEFLAARLDEDEQTARDWQRHKQALTEQFMNDPRRKHVRLRREPVTDAQMAEFSYTDRFDPDRMLAEVESNRRIMAEVLADCEAGMLDPHGGIWGKTLRLLALPYADHDDYQETWRP